MTWSAFTAYMTDNRRHISAGVFAEARRDGLARYTERLHAGRGDSVLTFDDIIARCEAAISGVR